MENKIYQTREELKKHLSEQLDFLRSSAESYDRGFISESKRMASVIRTLIHDTNKSHSLLGQLDLKKGKFFSTAVKQISIGENQQLAGSYSGLIAISMCSGKNEFIPLLDSPPSDITGYVNFDNYWDEHIFCDSNGNNHSRRELILSIANQDGGSHVDPGLDEKYAELSRQNSLRWISSDKDGNWIPIKGAELAAVRQIAHELLKTLIPNYLVNKANAEDGIILGCNGMIIECEPVKIGRNDPCSCGAKKEDGKPKKYKKCCGK